LYSEVNSPEFVRLRECYQGILTHEIDESHGEPNQREQILFIARCPHPCGDELVIIIIPKLFIENDSHYCYFKYEIKQKSDNL